MKRIMLFILTNIAIMVVLSITLRLLGVDSVLAENGSDLNIQALVKNFNPEVILNNINFERLGNNPRIVTKDDINKFLKIN